ALGPKGSIRDRLTPPGWVEGLRPRELYNTAALARYGALRRHFVSRFAAVFRRQAVYHGARQGAHIASAAMLYNSRGREPSTRLSGEADHRQNPWR
ncbi:hypothetical protein HMPREF9453_02028, partial [Dialister succinatiphilus YIT 11850]